MLNFKDKQAREEIEILRGRIVDLEYLLGVYIVPTFHDPDNKESQVIKKFFQLASTLGYEYKEESKEAGWVKKELPMNVTVDSGSGGGVSCGTGPFYGVPNPPDKPKKTKSK